MANTQEEQRDTSQEVENGKRIEQGMRETPPGQNQRQHSSDTSNSS